MNRKISKATALSTRPTKSHQSAHVPEACCLSIKGQISLCLIFFGPARAKQEMISTAGGSGGQGRAAGQWSSGDGAAATGDAFLHNRKVESLKTRTRT